MAAILAPLRHPLFRRFYFGQAVSRAGDFAFFIALPWQVIQLGGAEGEIGAVLAFYLGAQVVLALVGGVVVDRFSRQRVVVASDIAQGAIVAGFAALALSGGLTFVLLDALAAAFGAAQAVAFPAMGAFLPQTVPDEDLQPANALYQGTLLAASIVGSSLAAVLLSHWGTWSAFAFDAATFAASATLLGSVPGGLRRPGEPPKGSLVAQVKAGWSYVAGIPWLWITIALFAVYNAAEAGPRNVVLPVLIGVELGGQAAGIGLVLSAFMGGVLVGSFAPGFLPPFRRPGFVAYLITGLSGLLVILVAFATAVWQIAALFVVQGVIFGVFSNIWQMSLMRFVDERFRGRAISIDAFGSILLLPLSAAVSGAAAHALGGRTIFVLGGAIVLLCAAIGLVYPPAHRFEKTIDGSDQPGLARPP